MNNVCQTAAGCALGRQNTRLLRLVFPHGDGPADILLANRLEGNEQLSKDFEFTVEVLCDNASIPLSAIQGKMVCVELVLADGSLRYFNGHVFEFSFKRTDGSVAFYSMLLKPWLAYLKLRVDNYIFHEVTLGDQAKEIFADYGAIADWECRLSSEVSDQKMTMAIQYAESDHNYLHRRWEAAGWYYWYEHSASGHKLILSDDSTQAEHIAGSSDEVRFQRHAGSAEEDAIGEWSALRRIVASKVALSAFDFKAPFPQNVDLPTLNQQGQVLPIETYEYAGAYAFTATDGAALTRLRMEEIEASGKHFEATGNARAMLPGRSFRLIDHFDFPQEGDSPSLDSNEFLVVSVHHDIRNNYLQSVDIPAEYGNRLTCIRKKIPWRPGRGFNSIQTKLLAIQTATVVAQEGENMLTDTYGRIRVQFHWDRVGERNENSSAYVRWVSNWAGAELGMSAIPRQGMEVAIQWLEGNPDLPIATGCIPNPNNMPPWRLPDQQALAGLRSRELTPGGGNSPGGRSNHLVLDDTAGKIQAQLKSDHQHSQLSLGHITRIEDNAGRKEARGEGFALETGGAGAIRSAKGILLSTDGRSKAVGGTLSRDELVRCLEQALALAQGLGSAVAEGCARDIKPQQALTEAVEALGHGAGDEAGAKGAAAGGQPVIAISGEAGIASGTPRNQTHYAGQNIDTVAGNNQQHYAAKSLLHTAGRDIENFSVDGEIRTIAGKGKIIQQAQQNAVEITADKSVTIMSAKDHILVAADKHITLTSGGAYIKLAGGNIEIACPGNLLFKSAARSFTGPGSMAASMPTFDVGDTGRRFLLHRDGDKSDKLADHNYSIKLDNGETVEGRTAADGLTKLAEKDVMRIAAIRVWKDQV